MKKTNPLVLIVASCLGISSAGALAQPANKDAGNGSTTAADTTVPTIVDKGQVTTRYDVYEIIDSNSLTVEFAKGSSDLKPDDQKKLKDFVNRTKAESPVEKFVVAAWADSEYPPSGEALPENARKLADERGDKVENVLEEAGGDNIDTFEMTERPNWFQKAFATEGAEVKGTTKTEALSDEVMMKIGEKLRAKGGPGKAVVVARFEGAVVAH